MYKYLALLTLQEAYSRFYKWSRDEKNNIDILVLEAGKLLTSSEMAHVIHRLRKMKNSYHEDVLYSLGKMYWRELRDGDNYLPSPVEYDEKTYELWIVAARQKKSVQITYDSTTSGITKRLVDPYKTSSPYGEGYCHLRKEVRKFRIDRIIEIQLTDKSFTKPKDWEKKLKRKST